MPNTPFFGGVIGQPAVGDAFSRVRVSNPQTLFDSTFQYDLQPLLYEQITTAGGSIAHLPNQSSASLVVTGASGASAAIQSREYHRYQPGKSQMLITTFIMGAAVANVVKRVGYFDSSDGVYLEQNGTTDIAFTLRTSTSGSPSNSNRVVKSSWNIDKFDGTGPSGLVLDLTKAQILVIDLQWLGMGRVRCGFDINGIIYYAHQFLNANVLTATYMKTANLPNRWEISNSAASAGDSMQATCASVVSEGGFEDERGFTFTANNGITPVSVTTRRAVLSIRPKATFNSITNRALLSALEMEVGVLAQDAFIELVYNPTFTGTPTWTSVDASSITEFSVHGDAALGAITGGIVVVSLTAPNAAQRAIYTREILSKLPLVLDAAGANPIALSVVATRSSGSGTSSVVGHLNWKELR